MLIPSSFFLHILHSSFVHFSSSFHSFHFLKWPVAQINFFLCRVSPISTSLFCFLVLIFLNLSPYAWKHLKIRQIKIFVFSTFQHRLCWFLVSRCFSINIFTPFTSRRRFCMKLYLFHDLFFRLTCTRLISTGVYRPTNPLRPPGVQPQRTLLPARCPAVPYSRRPKDCRAELL